MVHSFDTALAEKYGIEEAIILQDFILLTDYYKKHNQNFYDGKYWVYSSTKVMTVIFTYMSQQKIKRVLKSLLDQGAIVSGCYNASPYDRTKWYSVNNEVYEIIKNNAFR